MDYRDVLPFQIACVHNGDKIQGKCESYLNQALSSQTADLSPPIK